MTVLRSRGVAPVALVGVAAMLLAACSSTSSTSSPTSASGSPSSSAAPASTCVSDPQAVISRQLPATATTASLPADLVAKLDAAAAAGFAQAAAPGAVVGVRTPEGTWLKAYGLADPETKQPMSTDVHQRIGSVTKTMTGTVILQLAQEGKLSLEDTISTYVDGVPNGEQITLRQLASMVSGVASYTRSTVFTDDYFAHPEKVFTPDELLAVGISESPLFPPGEKFDYSNTNTVLLGKVIERVTGSDIATQFGQRIFTPLELSGTSWPGDSPNLPSPYARGFTLQGSGTPQKPADATFWNPAWGWTAGEAISTVPDLLDYGRAIGTGQGLLDAEAQTARLTSFPGAAGYGIAMGCVDGWVGHTGELPGYNTSVFYDTTTDTTVITATNSDINSGDCTTSPVMPDNPKGIPCRAPATRIFVSISEALGHTFTPPPTT